MPRGTVHVGGIAPASLRPQERPCSLASRAVGDKLPISASPGGKRSGGPGSPQGWALFLPFPGHLAGCDVHVGPDCGPA